MLSAKRTKFLMCDASGPLRGYFKNRSNILRAAGKRRSVQRAIYFDKAGVRANAIGAAAEAVQYLLRTARVTLKIVPQPPPLHEYAPPYAVVP